MANNVQVDAVGDACPIPVVKTLKALASLGGAGTVETLVDNEVAVQNLTRMAHEKGCEVSSEQLGERRFRVTLIAPEGMSVVDGEADEASCPVPAANAHVR